MYQWPEYWTVFRSRATEGYVLQIEDEDGETTEFSVSFDQLEVIAEEIERHLDEDEDDEPLMEVEEYWILSRVMIVGSFIRRVAF